MKNIPKPNINSTTLFWTVYVAFLFVLWPQAAWTVDQFQDAASGHFTIMGVTASALAWALSGVFEVTIAIVTHKLNTHWKEMPTRYKGQDMGNKRFAYRWLNVYAVALLVAMTVSAVANYTHVVQFTNPSLKVFEGAPGVVKVYQWLFGLLLPAVSFVFARVLSTMQVSEQEDDPLFAKAKADLAEAKSTIRERDATIRQLSDTVRLTEQRLDESEQRYRAVGDVIRFLFGKDMALSDRIRGVRMTFPNLSQNGIAQIIGCSVSTVNGALEGFESNQAILVDLSALQESEL